MHLCHFSMPRWGAGFSLLHHWVVYGQPFWVCQRWPKHSGICVLGRWILAQIAVIKRIWHLVNLVNRERKEGLVWEGWRSRCIQAVTARSSMNATKTKTQAEGYRDLMWSRNWDALQNPPGNTRHPQEEGVIGCAYPADGIKIGVKWCIKWQIMAINLTEHIVSTLTSKDYGDCNQNKITWENVSKRWVCTALLFLWRSAGCWSQPCLLVGLEPKWDLDWQVCICFFGLQRFCLGLCVRAHCGLFFLAAFGCGLALLLIAFLPKSLAKWCEGFPRNCCQF